MIVFDKRTLQILKYIHKHRRHGVTWAKLQKKFGREDANIFLLEGLNKELYVVTKNLDGQWIDFTQTLNRLDSQFVSFATPKANEMIERLSFDFWKWMIPTFVSIAALVLSIVALSS